jgi:magnesium-protoporphyrin O-methyltransferase
VRAGRDRMRANLLSWLPDDLHGKRVLDAGCGTGAFAFEAARRGASVVAIDLSPTLVDLAWERLANHLDLFANGGHLEFRSGDMLDDSLGEFDHVVAMDSLIHYEAEDALRVLQTWAPRVRTSMLFTFAPRTPALAAMHAVGRLFPRGDRAPAIEPVAEAALRRLVAQKLTTPSFACARSERIASGFYTSQALELVRT